MSYIRWFSELGVDDVPLVGGKNASLGEMVRELAPQGVRVPNGFAITAALPPRARPRRRMATSAPGAGRAGCQKRR